MAQSLEPVSRVRSQGGLNATPNGQVQNIWTTCTQTSWTTTGSFQLFDVGSKSTMADYVVPGFHRRIQNGEVFFLPMYKETTTATRTGGAGTEFLYNTPIICSGTPRNRHSRLIGNEVENVYVAHFQGSQWSHIPGLADLVGQELSQLCVELSTRVLSDVGTNTDVDLWEDLAEVNKTLGTVHDLLKAIGGTILKGRLANRAASAASAYLIYRYGIRPTALSLVGVLDGLMKRVGRMRKSTRASASLNKQNVTLYDHVESTRTTSLAVIDKDEVEVRAMSLDAYNATLAFNVGFSPKSLLTLPWELIPYSFVVDWFANVGNFIGSLAPAIGFTHLGDCLVLRRKRSRLITCTGVTASSTTTIVSPASGSYELTYETISRGPLLAPAIVINSNFRFDNVSRCLDAAALLMQRLTRSSFR